jgi:hypothetical protein
MAKYTVTYPDPTDQAQWSTWLKEQWQGYTEEEKSLQQRQEIFKKLWMDQQFRDSEYFNNLFFGQLEKNQRLLQEQLLEERLEQQLEQEYLQRHPEQPVHPLENARFYQAVKNSMFSLEGYSHAFIGYMWANGILSVSHGLGLLLKESLELHNQICDTLSVEDNITVKTAYLHALQQLARQEFGLQEEDCIDLGLVLYPLEEFEEQARHELVQLRAAYLDPASFSLALNATITAHATTIALDRIQSDQAKIQYVNNIIDALSDQEISNQTDHQPGDIQSLKDMMKLSFKTSRVGQTLVDTESVREQELLGLHQHLLDRSRHSLLPAYYTACSHMQELSFAGKMHPALNNVPNLFTPAFRAIMGAGSMYCGNIKNYVLGDEAENMMSHQNYQRHLRSTRRRGQ